MSSPITNLQLEYLLKGMRTTMGHLFGHPINEMLEELLKLRQERGLDYEQREERNRKEQEIHLQTYLKTIQECIDLRILVEKIQELLKAYTQKYDA